MLEEENINISTQEVEEDPNAALDKALEGTTELVPLDVSEREIVQNIIEANTKDELDYQFELFNINQSKKNALRVIKLNNLLSKVEDQAIERFEKRPDQFSNKEVLEYMQVVASQIQQSQNAVNTLSDKPMIKVTNQKNELNINMGQEPLDRDSKAQVVDAITALLKQVKKSSEPSETTIVVEAEDAVIINSDENLENNTVLLNNEETSEEESK